MIIFKSIRRNLKKFILYSLSVGVGITAVLTVSSLADYGICSAQGSLDSIGLDGYTVSTVGISNDDYLKMCMAGGVKYASPIYTAKSTIADKSVTLLGIDKSIEKMYSLKMLNGVFFEIDDVLNCRSVCVISSNMSELLFNTDNSIGNAVNVSVNGVTLQLTVCGVYRSDPIVDGYVKDMVDERLYIPYTVLQPALNNATDSLAVMTYDNVTDAFIDVYASGIFGNNYVIKNIAADRSKIEYMMSTVKNILSIIGGLTLAVSAISLTIIMIINVRYSREEIGLKKSIGATDFHILSEVVTESVIISVIGYLLGTVMFLFVKFTAGFFSIDLNFEYEIALLSFIIVILSAAVAGVIPGIIAARTNPAVTLRN